MSKVRKTCKYCRAPRTAVALDRHVSEYVCGTLIYKTGPTAARGWACKQLEKVKRERNRHKEEARQNFIQSVEFFLERNAYKEKYEAIRAVINE